MPGGTRSASVILSSAEPSPASVACRARIAIPGLPRHPGARSATVLTRRYRPPPGPAEPGPVLGRDQASLASMPTSRADLSRIRDRVGCALAELLGQQRAVLGAIGPDMLPWP